jgi:D-glycero-alpha-D-manno-heptose-7-phosphate kinase
MRIISKSPCRVDMAGGTLDIWPLYLFHQNPTTVHFAVSRYTMCELVTRADARIVLKSKDLVAQESFESLDKLMAAKKYRLSLHAWLLRFFQPKGGLEMTTLSEAPAGAGISGSSSLMITAGAALNKLTGMKLPLEKLRETVQSIEAQIIRVPTGSQDYYPAMYGGVGYIKMSPAGIARVGVPLDLADFNSRIVLAYTGVPRNSGINNWEVMKAHISGDKKVQKNFDQIAAISYAMRIALEKRDWTEVGRLVRAEWDHRRKNIPTISTEMIDDLVASTRRVGALGAKVCGAGGGGCVFFFVEPDAKRRVEEAITRAGAQVLPVTVAPKGVQVVETKS